MRNFAFILATIGLAGCQAVPVSTTPRQITMNGVSEITISDATAQAQAHCATQGLNAQLVPDGINDGRATFNCVN